MKILKFLTAIGLSVVVSQSSYSQTKGDNAITVKGVTFDEVCGKLLDAGFLIDKKDSELQTVKTEFKDGTRKNKWMRYLINVRVKDSVATITGVWYNNLVLGQKVFGRESTVESLTMKTEYTSVNPKRCFIEMVNFAKLFGKPVTYARF